MVSSFQLGVENMSAAVLTSMVPHKKSPMCAGLITNQTGVDQHNNRTIDILLKNKCCDIRYIFVPEHGLTGVAAERDVLDSKDEKTSIPIMSLYKNGTGKLIAPDYLKNIDVLIFDIQDSGMRHYTYISTLLNTMKIAAEYNVPFIVLDRPNPLTGLMQGPLVDSDLISFISIAAIPLRHGMTIGELARYFNEYELKKTVSLHVVAMTEYDRTRGFMGKWLQQLSPNIKSLQSCYGYSFLGLIGEIEPFDVGVGTDLAFRCILLPESLHIAPSFWQHLENILTAYGIKSDRYSHIHPRSKKPTTGVKLEFCTINELKSFELFIDIMQLCKNNNISFSFSKAFNKAVGSKKVQDVIRGTLAKELFLKEINQDVDTFKQKISHLLLYT